MRQFNFRSALLVLTATFIPLTSYSLTAVAAPNVTQLDIRGFQIGKVTRIRLSGAELNLSPRLVGAFAFSSKIVGKPATNSVQFDVTVAPRVTPGLYNLWLVTKTGVSQKVLVAIDSLPQRPLTPQLTIPVAAHGSITGSQKRTASFQGKRGQVVMVSVEAKRLGSRVRPVVQLFDPNNQLVGWSMPKPQFHGDARIRVKLPVDGKYQIRFNDLEYAAPAPGFFRLKVGTWQPTDMPYPSVINRSGTTKVALIGSTGTVDVKPLAGMEQQPIALTGQASGPKAYVRLTDHGVSVEPLTGSKITMKMTPAPSFGCGRIRQSDEMDKWEVPVTPGSKVRVRLIAQTFGSPLDGFIEVRDSNGKVLGSNDDAGGRADSQLDVTVPKQIKSLLVHVTDRNRLGGEHFVYQLSVAPIVAAQPDFALKVDNFRVNVASGDRTVFRVLAQRSGYKGPIQLRFRSLPVGLQVQMPQIGAGQMGVLVTISGVGHEAAASVTQLIGSATIAGKTVERIALDAAQPGVVPQPWLRREMLLAIGNSPGPVFDAGWSSLGGATKLVLGSEAPLSVRGFRPVGSDGPIRLALLSSQTPILNKKRQVDAGRMLRFVRGTEIPADKTSQGTFDAIAPLRKPLAVATAKVLAVRLRTGKEIAAAQANQKPLAAAAAAAQSPLTQLLPTLTAADRAAQLQGKIVDRLGQTVDRIVSQGNAQVNSALAALDEAEGSEPALALALAQIELQRDAILIRVKQTKDAKSRGILQAEADSLANLDVSVQKQVNQAKVDLLTARKLVQLLTKSNDLAIGSARASLQGEVAKAKQAVEKANQLKKKVASLQSVADAAKKNLLAANEKLRIVTAKVKAEVTASVTAMRAAQQRLTATINSAEQAAKLANQETKAVVAIPATLAAGTYMFAVRAELLSRDKKRVLATRTLPVRQFRVVRPFTLTLDKPQWVASLDPAKGTVAIVTGKLMRQGGFTGVVAIGASGLPKGVKASGSAAANQDKFTLRIQFNKNQKPAKLNLRVFGTGRFTSKLPVVRAADVPTTLTLAAAAKKK